MGILDLKGGDCMDWNKIKSGLKDVTDKGVELAGNKMEQKKEEMQEKKEQKKEEQLELQERIKQMDKEGIIYCPKCYSTQITANKKGFSLGKAAAGSLIAGGVLLGAVGKNKIEVTCLKCGNKWKAGKK